MVTKLYCTVWAGREAEGATRLLRAPQGAGQAIRFWSARLWFRPETTPPDPISCSAARVPAFIPRPSSPQGIVPMHSSHSHTLRPSSRPIQPGASQRRRTQLSFQPLSPTQTFPQNGHSDFSHRQSLGGAAIVAPTDYNSKTGLGTRRSVNLNSYGIPKQPMRRRNSIAAPAKQTARLSYQGPIGNEFEAKIRVCVRKRPLNSRELNRGETDIVQATGRRSVTVHEPKVKVDLTKYVEQHHFIFDEVFDETVTNDEMYQRTAQPLVRFIFQGGNATCFAYGQTGSGKTYTMLDPRNGLYVLAASDIFAMHTQPEYQHLTVLVSFYEIYQSQLYDLLNNRKKLHAREDHRQQVCISGLREIEIENVVDLMEVFEFGNSERSTGSTGANADSSRSHAILQIMLKDDRDNDRLHGKFSFIDLAGSERGADRGESDKQTRMEGSEINKSLLALKECIRALDMDKKHTPFRQSKLTQVLKDSLVGNSRTCMIATVTPNISNSEHSLNTLRYTDRVKAIKGERGTSDCRDTDSANTGQGDDEGYDDAHYYGEPDDWDDGDRASHDPPEDYDGDLYYDCEQDTIDTASNPSSNGGHPSSAPNSGRSGDRQGFNNILDETPSFRDLNIHRPSPSPPSDSYARIRSPPAPEPVSHMAPPRRYNLRSRTSSNATTPAPVVPPSAHLTSPYDEPSVQSPDLSDPSASSRAARRLRQPSMRRVATADYASPPDDSAHPQTLSQSFNVHSSSVMPPPRSQRRPTSYRTQPSPNAMEPPVAQRSTAAPSQKVYFDLAEIDEFVKQHRLQIRETSDYCKLETRLVASYTLGASSGPSPQGSLRSHKYYEGDNDGDDAKVLAQMHSAVSYLEQLDEILDKKQNAVVQLRNSIRQLVYSQSQSQNRQ
ncbi:hypothetical protein H4R33_000148 [Dimargaris cristalligena]|nr:hypothetical protein H4R33_000148 [Dimargaris cristalligena]